MIRSKEDYNFYLEADRIALRLPLLTYSGLKGRLEDYFFRDIWRFVRLLRKTEYYLNCKMTNKINRAYYYYLRVSLHRTEMRLHFQIEPNCIGPGLSIARVGVIVVHPKSRIGENCRLHPDVIIGAKAGHDNDVPKIGNNVFIGPGAKIFGDITIADGIAIGANSVVTESFLEPNITIAGIPAKKVSNNGSKMLLENATEIVRARQKNAR